MLGLSSSKSNALYGFQEMLFLLLLILFLDAQKTTTKRNSIKPVAHPLSCCVRVDRRPDRSPAGGSALKMEFVRNADPNL